MAKNLINKLYVWYACYPPFIIYDVKELTLKTPISEEEAKSKVEEGNFNVEDFEENFETEIDNLPTGVKYVFSLDKHEAEDWAYNEAMYGE